MARYYFDIHDGSDFVDDEGYELPDLRSARMQAVVLAGEMMRDRPEAFWDHQDWTMVVSNDSDLTLFTLTFFVTIAPAMGDPATATGPANA